MQMKIIGIIILPKKNNENNFVERKWNQGSCKKEFF